MNLENNAIKIVLSTHDDVHQARELAHALVEQGVAACVSIVPNVISVFRWEGAIQSETEHMLFIKTTDVKLESLKVLLEELHSYDVPEIVALDGAVLHEPYLQWIGECLQE